MYVDYANSVDAVQTSPISLICIIHRLTKLDLWLLKHFSKQQKQTIFVQIGLNLLLSDPETQKPFLSLYNP